MKKTAPVVAFVLAILLVPSIAFGADASPWTEQSSNVDKAIHKLDYGIKNLLGGWTEVIRVPLQYHKDGANIAKGLGQGIVNAVVYSIGGALHTGTFFLPQIDIPIQDGGVQFG